MNIPKKIMDIPKNLFYYYFYLFFTYIYIYIYIYIQSQNKINRKDNIYTNKDKQNILSNIIISGLLH